MNSPNKTMADLEAEEQALMAELTGVENALMSLHDREHDIRNSLQHIEIQKTRLLAVASIQ